MPLKTQPDPKEWAKVIGISVDYELPENFVDAKDTRHTDLNLQSLQFDAALNLSVKKLASDAKIAVDETGNNILFLCVGFLEWSVHVNSSKKRLAPLYLIPITITKEYTNGIAVNVIKYTGEDILPNLILEEKLKQDFDLTLPSIISPDNEDKLLSSEKYFSEITSLIELKNNDLVVSGWKVRRYATLATLSLGKLLMYKDLIHRIFSVTANKT